MNFILMFTKKTSLTHMLNIITIQPKLDICTGLMYSPSYPNQTSVQGHFRFRCCNVFHQKLPFLSNSPCLFANSLCSCSKLFVCSIIHCGLQNCPVFQFKFLSSHSGCFCSQTSARSRSRF